jgi:simple sugar transport system permease protein
MKNQNSIFNALKGYMVPIIFTLLCIVSIIIAGKPMSYVLGETMSRVTRNTVLILSLILPVLCGMGLNFSIVLGAMAGEVGLIMITYWKIGGLEGMMIAMFIATVVAIALGVLTGKLFNKVKGQEMIVGMILGFFAIGVYDLIFLCLVGTVIPMVDPTMMVGLTKANGHTTYVGLANTINLLENTKYALDHVCSIMFINLLPWLIIACFVIAAGIFMYKSVYKKLNIKAALRSARGFGIPLIILAILQILIKTNETVYEAFFILQVPVFTWVVITLVCLLTVYITKTKLGQDIRTVGKDMRVAFSAGINVDRTRIIATVMSTIIAAWGQIIFLQNIGNIQTYSSHEYVGIYSVAAILVGGASIEKATIGQVFAGAVLFHILFFITPLAGAVLFGDFQLGEFFRVFLCYGIIGVSLVLFAWKKYMEDKRQHDEECRRQGTGVK